MRRLAAALLLLAGTAAACPVCFGGDPDQASLGRAFNVAIVSMLLMTFGLLLSGAWWIWRMERRRQAVDRQYLEMLGETPRAEAPVPSAAAPR